jgi:hypothetical protein
LNSRIEEPASGLKGDFSISWPVELPMVWFCPQEGCHFENPDGESRCSVCGYQRIASRLALVSSSGKSIDMGITTTIGRLLLAGLGTGEEQYAASEQFRILKTESGWMVQHQPTALNPTCFQGKPLPAAPVQLEDGGILSIGREFCKLTIRFIY